MKIHYLGSGAAEGIPAVFCECSVCKSARQQSGREIRTRMQALIDDKILIDFGPDTYMHSLQYGIDLSLIKYCLITHAHEDHLYPHDIRCRKKNRALLEQNTHPLHLFGGQGVKGLLNPLENGYVTKDGNVIFHSLTPFQEIELDNYSIMAIPAIHNSNEPFVYAIKKDDKAILYCHDSDILDESTLQNLAEQGFAFDLVSMDCTEGKKHIDYRGHMNFERNRIMSEMLLHHGLVGDDTVFVLGHISHNGLVSHCEAEEIISTDGFVVAYDGLVINF